MMILAGVDIGTLTCRLLIAHVSSGGPLTEMHSERRILRLGEGVDRQRTLHPAAMARVIDTLKAWRHTIDTYPVDRVAAVATSAVRDADNREEFLARIQQEAGFSVEVISGEEEARRTMLGIRSGLPPGVSDVLGLDIGGGSTEFILDRRGQSPIVRSLDLGVVRLTERWLKHDPPDAGEVRAARTMVQTGAAAVQPLLRDLSKTTVVGTAGTITTLAAMAQRLPIYEPDRVHRYRLRLEVIANLEGKLLASTQAERRGWPGLEAGREEVIVAGVIILRTVMDTLGIEECLVSELGLREGLLLDLAAREKEALGRQPSAVSTIKKMP
jgi:exopolyphosphatase/guanosine-5'-triphosphate,3'-diphosphate pyrophosphatase